MTRITEAATKRGCASCSLKQVREAGQAAENPPPVVDVEGRAGRRPADSQQPAVREVTIEEGEREELQSRQEFEEGLEKVEEMINRQ